MAQSAVLDREEMHLAEPVTDPLRGDLEYRSEPLAAPRLSKPEPAPVAPPPPAAGATELYLPSTGIIVTILATLTFLTLLGFIGITLVATGMSATPALH
jgi:hypothetical protein